MSKSYKENEVSAWFLAWFHLVPERFKKEKC